MANHLTFPHLIQVFYGSGQPLDQLRSPLQQFLRNGVLGGREATAENIVQAVDALVNDMQEELRETAVRHEMRTVYFEEFILLILLSTLHEKNHNNIRTFFSHNVECVRS